MTLNPIKVLDDVIEEYRNYLETEFRAKDPQLKKALEAEIDRQGFLSAEPFFQAHRPFKHGDRWRELPIDPKLASIMETRAGSDHAFLHQSDAIKHLLGPQASPLVVTTGTGSGKTECFLLPVIQNAVDDALKFKKSGLTAILLYPMNALANDQLDRIKEFLRGSGYEGLVSVEKYDRGTSQSEREKLRANPPHILLTNYMMLEYLLVRPADREDIFANHRCRFLVLDEVHTYRGTLGSNIALLVRRVKAHLARARQDWRPNPENQQDQERRYPSLITVGTSATIKSMDEGDLPRDEVIARRDKAVREFFSSLTGAKQESIVVLGEELEQVEVPEDARYGAEGIPTDIDYADEVSVTKALDTLSGSTGSSDLSVAARRCRILWDLNSWLVKKPMSISQMVERIQSEVPERKDRNPEDIRQEVRIALRLGAVLPDGTPGALRLKAHRFVRGGWQFHRCVNPSCGKLYPMGEELCECGYKAAPLYLCRNCGADYLRFTGSKDPEADVLRPSAVLGINGDETSFEWMLYDPTRLEVGVLGDYEDDADDEEQTARALQKARDRQPGLMRKRPVEHGSFDPVGCTFSRDEDAYPLKATLAPARTQCLSCGGTAGSRNVVTPVALGTSAAVKVLAEGLMDSLAEENVGKPGYDGKERLLVFSDSRQDAAHQARFIDFASRYDRMRRRVVALLQEHGELSIQRIVEFLDEMALHRHDNPHLPSSDITFVSEENHQRIRAWEEAPLLDELAVNAGYRATLVNLGLVHVSYQDLDKHIATSGKDIMEELGLSLEHTEYLCRCLLDEMRVRGCLNRDMLRYHPLSPRCPDYVRFAKWERKVKQPNGYAADDRGYPLANMDSADVPSGIRMQNAWRKPRAGGRGPSLERIFKHLIDALGGAVVFEPEALVKVLELLRKGQYITASELFGARQSIRLMQVNAERVRLALASEHKRCRCSVCGNVMAGAETGWPCPSCHGRLVAFSDSDVKSSRYVQRIYAPKVSPLFAAEHTAQVTNDDRIAAEEMFKSSPNESPLNVLACSPTLEMGIDIGGLDAIILRNVPPRPDNYAQRGGRAGRRQRVGLVVGYARKTPHDQYFYDKPEEMIAGEVPAPALALGNRDVIRRHLAATAFGGAEPGLSGKMVDYVSPMGKLKQEAVDALIAGIKAQFSEAVKVAEEAWASDVLPAAEVTSHELGEALQGLPTRIQDVFDRTALQVQQLRKALDEYATELKGARAGQRAGNMIARLLGIPSEDKYASKDADDRSAGYPLRRFAEFGILPGYEFPSEPATLRLLGDPHEEEPVSSGRRYGIDQFKPEAQVYARGGRWKVVGLDTASPWNPRSDEPGWRYRVCGKCGLRYDADNPFCPCCRTNESGQDHPGMEYAGFLATRDEGPILDEEERYASKNLVEIHAQWDGDVVGRWTVAGGWGLRLSRGETVKWLNEGVALTAKDREKGVPCLHNGRKGFYVCSSCWRVLTMPDLSDSQSKGRKSTSKGSNDYDPYRHGAGCPLTGTPPRPVAIVASGQADILRLIVPVPKDATVDVWGHSLGYALRRGMLRSFALSEGDIDFSFEGAWETTTDGTTCRIASLAFVDPNLGGSGYLPRIAEAFDRVASQALEHLDHSDCETSCYRCLKSYDNQRFHDFLQWPRVTGDLEAIAGVPPDPRPAQTGDIDDPKPWLEAYTVGVGSPLELKFLRLFEQQGLQVEKQVAVAASDMESPISIADFAIPDKRIAIYIDGAAFHSGQNLRRDRFIRNRLRQGTPAWKVVELRAKDLGAASETVKATVGSELAT